MHTSVIVKVQKKQTTICACKISNSLVLVVPIQDSRINNLDPDNEPPDQDLRCLLIKVFFHTRCFTVFTLL